MAIRFRSAWNNRRFKSDIWLWTFSVGGVVIVHDIWTLWIASKKIRHGGNSWFVYRNCFPRSAVHRLDAGLVRARCPAFAPYHPRLFTVPRADRHIFPRRVCLPRTIHAQSFHHLRIDLDRSRDLYRRSRYAMAQTIGSRDGNA